MILKKKFHPTRFYLSPFYIATSTKFCLLDSYIEFREKFQTTRLFQPTLVYQIEVQGHINMHLG